MTNKNYPALEPSHDVPNYAVDYYLDNISMMNSLCADRGIRYHWFLQPTLFLKNEKTPDELEVFFGSYSVESHDIVDTFSRAFQREVRLKNCLRCCETCTYSDIFWNNFHHFYQRVVQKAAIKFHGSVPVTGR